jgi:hypothetical protein
MYDRKWIQVLGLALSLPSTIFFAAWGLMELSDRGIISKGLAVFLFLAIIGNTLFLMVWHAYKNKNKS